MPVRSGHVELHVKSDTSQLLYHNKELRPNSPIRLHRAVFATPLFVVSVRSSIVDSTCPLSS